MIWPDNKHETFKRAVFFNKDTCFKIFLVYKTVEWGNVSKKAEKALKDRYLVKVLKLVKESMQENL